MIVNGVAVFTPEAITAAHDTAGNLWHEFLRVPEMSMGLYVLPAGSVDPQNPHNEDEVYLIQEGIGVLRVEDRDYPVKAGSLIYVEKQLAHKFHSITEDLRVLVFFATAHI